MSETSRARIAWWLLLCTATTHFCLAYLQNCPSFLDLHEYIRGASRLPYQYRVLMAWMLGQAMQIPHLATLAGHLPVALRDPLLTILFVSSWLSLFGSVVLTWRSLTVLTGNEEYSRWASLLVIYMAYFQFPLVFGLNFLLPYDLPSLFFFCGCLYCVIAQRMGLFYLFFTVGALNRETICMATLFWLIWCWKSEDFPRKWVLPAHALAQASIWILIRVYLHHRFGGNTPDAPGATFYYKLGANLHSLAEPKQWPVLFSMFGFTLPLILLWRKWMKCRAMEYELYLVGVWFVVMLLVGLLIEIRVFTELISYLALALSLILYNRFIVLTPSTT